MGATAEQGSDANNDEKPAHQVTLSSFSIGKYEVTQDEWQTVMGSNPSHFKGAKRPVEQVSWTDCQEFISKLNQLTGRRFRLPTEAEWEYAARGGNRSQGYKYAGSNDLQRVAWYWENSGDRQLSGEWDPEKITANNCCTHPVGQKSPNELGLYDMSGNVWEWCQDWYGSYSSSQTNPTGPGSGSYRVRRGGCWNINTRDCRSSYRNGNAPSFRNFDLGLRLAL
jgi:formylglycine-generating enzyme required for sulfatase activity